MLLTFNASDTQRCFAVTILDDFLEEEPSETFLLSLNSSDTDLFRPLATVVIVDDDERKLLED